MAINIRLPDDLHDQAKLFKFATGKSINTLLTDALSAYLADGGAGRAELVKALNGRTQQRYGEALDKLA
jgi:hypothetical protein